MGFLGIDIGTSAVKVVVTDDKEGLIASDERPLATSRPRPGWSEQDASLWCDAVASILDGFAALSPSPLAAVEGIGLSGQMHGAVCLGADDRPLRPVILWNDARAAAEASELNERFPDLAKVLGVPAMPGFTAPKLLWMRRHEPAIADAVRLVLLPKDHVRLWLTGERVTDMSDAAGSWWLDEAARDWSPAALEATGASLDMMPRLVEGTAASGVLRPALAKRWGIRDGAVVAGGAGDAMAGAIGIGAVEDGPFLSIGTSAQLFAPGRVYQPLPEHFVHAFCHAAPGRWAQIAALLNGASCLAWAAGVLGQPIEALLREVAEAPDRPAPLIFLPYLTGERTPHNDVEATGAFFGLTAATERSDLVRAVLEGVAYSFADAAACLGSAGTRLAGAAIVGGGARSLLWVQILADVLGIPLTRYQSSEKGPAFGAARLARVAATGEDILDVARPPPVQDVTIPRADRTASYAGKVDGFRRLYAATKAAR
jgi:xylulokinase